MKKRVLIFSLTYHPFVGGAEVAMREITARCQKGEYAFEMITLRFDSDLPKEEMVGNILVHRIGFAAPDAWVSDRRMPLRCKIAKALFPLSAFWKAMMLHRQHRFDLVWAMMANQAGFAGLFFNWMYPRVPYLLELQDGRPFVEMKNRRPSLRLFWAIYRRIYLRADVIKCISYFIAEQVRILGYRGRVEIIPNGVDMPRFSEAPDPEKVAILKTKHAKGAGDVFLFTASRLVLSRGVEDVIGSLAFLPANVKFLIAGSGEDREKLERIAIGLHVAERVKFAGHVSHDDLPAYLAISDIFVRPSIIEGMGNAFIEAFAAGVPIIGTRVGGIPDFLKEGETGLFCEVRNPESIAHAVQRYIDEPHLRARVVENAKRLAAEKYDWDLIAHKMREKIFNAL